MDAEKTEMPAQTNMYLHPDVVKTLGKNRNRDRIIEQDDGEFKTAPRVPPAELVLRNNSGVVNAIRDLAASSFENNPGLGRLTIHSMFGQLKEINL